MLFNNIGWLTYGILINNLFVFFCNVIPLCLAVWFNLVAIELQYAEFRSNELKRSIVVALKNNLSEDSREAQESALSNPLDLAKIVWDVVARNTKAPVAHKTIIMILTVIWAAILCLISMARSFPLSTNILIVGVAVNLNLVIFYASPLSTILTVFQTGCSCTIHVATTLTILFSGVFWSAFGFATGDWVIIIPNTMGVLLSSVQLGLCIVYPRKNEVTGSLRTIFNKSVAAKEDTIIFPDDESDEEHKGAATKEHRNVSVKTYSIISGSVDGSEVDLERGNEDEDDDVRSVDSNVSIVFDSVVDDAVYSPSNFLFHDLDVSTLRA
jgi:hypothetical protein